MTTVKDDKRAPPDLEKVIDSDRYKVVKFLGRGCWGSVYEAEDLVRERTVAIKVFDPTDTAKKQMKERNLDELSAMKNEALDLEACANIAPRTFEIDNNGTPFIIMPKYDKFFSDVIASPRGGMRWGPLGEEKPFKTGFCMSDIIQIAGDLANGIKELHEKYGRAHCDIKPDNLPVDKNGKILISDMGTSTFTSMKGSKDNRDNMGYAYTRSPQLFVEGVHPRKSSDIFAVGSLLYKLFTGEYILQRELDEESNKGEDAVRNYMTAFVISEKDARSKTIIGSSHTYTNTFSGIIEQKLKNKDIPAEFKELIESCVHERLHDGDMLKSRLERTIKEYTENRIKKSKFDEFKVKTRNNFLAAFGCGTMLAGLAFGAAWLSYFVTRPDFSNRTDIETLIDTRNIEKSEIVLEIERKYEKPFEIVGTERVSPYLLEHHASKYGDKTLADKITTQWLNSADDAGVRAFTDEMHMRYNIVRPAIIDNHQPVENIVNEFIRAMVTHYIGACQTSEHVVDLEDALTITRVGRDALYKAQKVSGSTEFNTYISAKDEKGAYVIPYADQAFLKRLLYRVTQAVPQIVRLAPGSSQSEQDGKSHEDKK